MTDLQKMRSRALAEAALAHGAGSSRNFVKQLAYWVEHQPERVLTPRQAEFLTKLCWTYRRQIPAALVPAQNPYPENLDEESTGEG